jgi:hypothetical protein
MFFFAQHSLNGTYWEQPDKMAAGSWLLAFLEKVAVRHPEAPIGMLYTWMATVDKAEEATWGKALSKEYMFPQHEKGALEHR